MTDIDVLLTETRVFPPPPGFRETALVRDRTLHERAEADAEGYWADQARTLHWQRPWEQALDWRPPHARWFVGGQLNVAENCLDRHLAAGLGTKAALIWEGEPGDQRTLTYWELAREVRCFANVLKHLGVQKGDRVGIYLPLIPEAAIAKIGRAHV